MKRRGFTLVELMIVVSILGILAAIVLPKFSDSTQQAKESAIKDTLHTIRAQIELYKMQHNGLYPGYMNGGTAFGDYLTYQFVGTSQINGFSRADKTPSDPYLYGPYLIQMPKNPFNDLNTISMVPDGTTTFTPTNSTGWLYERTTGTFKINITGTDSDNVAYVNY